MVFAITSPAFRDGGAIPAEHTCDGQNLAPPLEWHDAPAGTRSFVLVLEDPDAPRGVFRHWALYDIPGDHTGLAKGVQPGGTAGRLTAGVNDFGRPRYDGPCPPPGHGVHHYHFRLAALDAPSLKVAPGATVAEVWAAARRNMLGEADLTGTYAR